MRYIVWMILCVVLCFSSCSSDSGDLFLFDLGTGEIQMLYQETQCADPWYNADETDVNVDMDGKISMLLSFLESKGIEVLAASYKLSEENAFACLECHCQTGGVYYIKVHDKTEVMDALTQMGFRFE